MPKIQINVPDDIYQKLKMQAKDDERSLTKYITRGLTYLANIPNGYHNNTNITNTNNIIDLSALPEGTKITTTTKSKKKIFHSYPHRDLIREAESSDFFPSGLRVHNDDNEPFTDDEYQQELEQIHDSIRLHPDFITLKNYYDSFISSEEERSEARERLIAMRHSKDVISHETVYLEQIFKFTPPEDEPTLDLATYISHLLQGGWYDNTTVCLKEKDRGFKLVLSLLCVLSNKKHQQHSHKHILS